MKNAFPLIVLFGVSLMLSNAAAAQIAAGRNYTLDQTVVALGGTSAGGTFKIEGTAGQSAAGIRRTNAAYNFYSVFGRRKSSRRLPRQSPSAVVC